MPVEFLLTSLIVVLLPGTGVLYTVSVGLTRGAKASVYAACGCTVGIIPHLVASVFGLAAILHASAVLFQTLKCVGVCYLVYLAWGMWKDSGALTLEAEEQEKNGYVAIVGKAVLINLLNPKLSLFFLAFLPQFVPAEQASPMSYMLMLSSVFMAMTFVVFSIYGLLANKIRYMVLQSPQVVRWIQKSFAGLFVLMGIKLATMDRS